MRQDGQQQRGVTNRRVGAHLAVLASVVLLVLGVPGLIFPANPYDGNFSGRGGSLSDPDAIVVVAMLLVPFAAGTVLLAGVLLVARQHLSVRSRRALFALLAVSGPLAIVKIAALFREYDKLVAAGLW